MSHTVSYDDKQMESLINGLTLIPYLSLYPGLPSCQTDFKAVALQEGERVFYILLKTQLRTKEDRGDRVGPLCFDSLCKREEQLSGKLL